MKQELEITMKIEVVGIENFPIIKKDDNLPEIIYDTLEENGIQIHNDDIFIVAETVVAKAEGNIIEIDSVTPTQKAYEIAEISGKDPKQCQIILDNTVNVIKCLPGLIITETPYGFICANSAVDNSNCEEGYVTPLPVDPDFSAQQIKKYLDKKSGKSTAVIISDTQGRPWRVGAMGVAVGISGMHPCTDFRGMVDLYGQPLQSTIEATADELASAASLLMGQADSGICVVLIRGYNIANVACNIGESTISEILRDPETDAFR